MVKPDGHIKVVDPLTWQTQDERHLVAIFAYFGPQSGQGWLYLDLEEAKRFRDQLDQRIAQLGGSEEP